jgi:Cu+-exporting ATPase
MTLFLLATPVVLGPGGQFFVQSARGLWTGVTDMNLLYATGIGAAYLIGVLNTFFPRAGFGGERAIFFASAVPLTAFVILGKYLEALTRGRTSGILGAGRRARHNVKVRGDIDARIHIHAAVVAASLGARRVRGAVVDETELVHRNEL